MSSCYTLVLVRHGESSFLNENRFCGWIDADLSESGVAEAHQAGQRLRENGYQFDIAFASVLKRSIKSLNIILDELDQHYIEVRKHWRLNERMYGALQGLNKSETAAKYGEEQVKIWRRSYDIPPPEIQRSGETWPGNDKRYKFVDRSLLPVTESLKDTGERVLPYWFDVIVPQILSGKHVLISTHGTVIRALLMHLDAISEREIVEVNVPTGIPLVYELDKNLKPISHRYLADDATVRTAVDKILAQGKAK